MSKIYALEELIRHVMLVLACLISLAFTAVNLIYGKIFFVSPTNYKLSKLLPAGHAYTYNETYTTARLLADATVTVQAVIVFIFVVSASILLVKLNRFADLHSSNREEHRKEYLFIGLYMSLIAFAGLFSFSCTVPLIVETYYEDPEITITMRSLSLFCNVLSMIGIILLLQPTDLDDFKRPLIKPVSTENSKSSSKKSTLNSHKVKLRENKAEEPVVEDESMSVELFN